MGAYKKHADEIFRFYFARIYAREIAEDLLQETFIRTWKYIIKDKKINNLRAFLYQISRNLIRDYYRKNSLRLDKEDGLEMVLKSKKNFNKLCFDERPGIENKALLEEVFCTIKKLPGSYQEVLILRYVEDFKPKEIAKILKTTPRNISVKISKAKRKLDQIFNHEHEIKH